MSLKVATIKIIFSLNFCKSKCSSCFAAVVIIYINIKDKQSKPSAVAKRPHRYGSVGDVRGSNRQRGRVSLRLLP